MSLVMSLLVSTLFIGFLLEEHLTLGSNLSVGEINATRCIEDERQALLIFKQSLVDDSGFLSSWGNGDGKRDCCKWRGVICSNRTGHILVLNLHSTDGYLGGTISPSLLDLFHLNYMDLSFNNFNGSNIPEFIGSIRNLRYLDLSYAGFSGPIPYQLGNLSRLLSLDLHGNDLYSIRNLDWLSHLSSLKNLDLGLSNLSKANDWVQVVNKLPFLESLSLQSCNLPNIISPFLSLINSSTALTSLELFGNILTSSVIYPWLFNLKGSILKAFGNMKALKQLSLFSNQLEGGIPKSFRNMCSLQSLLLHHNHLSGDFTDYTKNLSGCTEHSLILDLHGNFLKGVILETHFSNLSNLQTLDLSYNSLSLEFSNNWILPFRLSFIHLGSCKSGPRFPNWIQITGGTLQLLDLSENLLSRTVLNLAGNNFSGRIPSSIGSLVSLVMFNLHNNSFSEELPSSLNNCTALEFVDLSDNKLSGEIPSWIGQSLTSLVFLSLQANKFNGGIPYNLCDLVNLQILDLSRNKLSGTIPQCLSSLTSMVQNGNLSTMIQQNYVYGREYEFTKNLGLLLVIDLSSNELSGEIPGAIASLSGLVALNLSWNILTGVIPQKIGQLRRLEVLDLFRNRFSGDIPTSTAELTFLSHLDLSYNNLLGKIPLSTQLQNFDASAFSNNLALYGPPVSSSCSATETPQLQQRSIN
ncbi:hypothetical protein CRYUN_Cryun07bG0111100 [Craigia yunnanensis]